MQLLQSYDPKTREAHWQQHWLDAGTYHWQNDAPREETFVIDTPPPTVSGVLHMGHIFSYTQADFIARFQRMRGKDVFYPMGFDDNGLPTERLVEKIKGVRGSSMPRPEFVALCREVVVEAEDEFRRLFRSTGLSVDWRQEYQTNSDDVRALSQQSFLDLVEKDQVYRAFRPTYWDWVDQTAIASAEIENKDMPGVMCELRFTLEEGMPITIMTTRPELLGACVAVMYHPEDPNATKYANAHAITPLFGVKVPMIADAMVDREKGTGLVMCCTFGDDTDKIWWQKHGLPMRTLLRKDGKLDFGNDLYIRSFNVHQKGNNLNYPAISNTPPSHRLVHATEALQGLKPKQAHTKIIELLTTSGELLKQTPMTHAVKCAERSGTPIEIIPTHQWFIKLMEHRESLLTRGEQCQWYPEFMRLRLNQWIEGLKEDWCISRQRFFGVPFPVWYSKRAGEKGKVIYADASVLPIDPLTTPPTGYRMDEVEPSTDIMDTWATSSLTTQINARALHAPDGERFGKLFPADLRPQAHEIIRTWAFYTIAKAHLHNSSIPWKNLMISGWCLAADKSKMSKSKGNVVTPVALIEEKGADAVRYWASTSRLGTDTAFSEDLLKIGRKLVTKLWNAANLVAKAVEGSDEALAAPEGMEILDRWIISRLHHAVKLATEAFERFEYAEARVALEDFFWNDFCDNYLELVKARAYEKDASALITLQRCLHGVLKLFAPFIPHVTEEIYTALFQNEAARTGSIHARNQWPAAESYPQDLAAEAAGQACLTLLNIVRKAKSEAGVSIKFPVASLKIARVKQDVPLDALEAFAPDLKAAGSIEMLEWLDSAPEKGSISEDGQFHTSLTLGTPAEAA